MAKADKKNNRIKNLVWIIALFTTAIIPYTSASSSLQSNLIQYFTLDNVDYSAPTIYDSSPNSYTAANNGATSGAVGINNEGFNFSTAIEYLNLGYKLPSNANDNFTISMWFKTNHNYSSGYEGLLISDDTTASNPDFILYVNSNQKLQYSITDTPGTTTTTIISSGTVNDGNFHNVIIIKNNTGMTLYLDGTLSEYKNANTNDWDRGDNLFIGNQRTDNYRQFYGIIDEVGLWNRSLSSSEITSLYNYGNSLPYPFYLSNNRSINFNIKNEYDNSTVYNFTVTATNGTITYNDSTTDGNVNLNLGLGLWNYNITVPYFYENLIQVSNYNVVSDETLNNYAIQSLLNISTYAIISNIALFDFNASIPLYSNSTTGNNLLLISNNTQQVISAKKTGYIDSSATATATEGYITNVNITFSKSLLTITGLQAEDNVSISDMYVSVKGINLTYNTFLSNATGNKIQFPLNTGSYNFTVSSTERQNKTLTINISSDLYPNSTAYLYAENSILINFKDEITKQTINNATLEVISSVYASNYSTSNGSLYITSLLSSDYELRYSAPDYSRKSYFIEILPKSFNELTLYLISASNSENTTITVYDQNNNPLSDLIVKSQRYDINTNSYLFSQMIKTDNNGKGIMALQLYTERYIFLISNDLTQLFESNSQYINSNTLEFRINIGGNYGQYEVIDINTISNISYINISNTFQFFYNDISNFVSEGCMYVYKITNLTKDLFNSTCIDGNTGTILLIIPNATSTTFVADGYIRLGGTLRYKGSAFHSFFDYLDLGNQGLFWLAVFEILIVFVGSWNLVVAVILIPIPMILLQTIGFIDLGWTFIITIILICLFGGYIMSDRS